MRCAAQQSAACCQCRPGLSPLGLARAGPLRPGRFSSSSSGSCSRPPRGVGSRAAVSACVTASVSCSSFAPGAASAAAAAASRSVACAAAASGLGTTIAGTPAPGSQQAPEVAATAGPGAAKLLATAAAAQRALPFAALSRVLLTGNNSALRSALNQRRQPVSGPMGLLLFLLTLVAASFAAIRSLLVKKGKGCRTCRGFGLQRCRLCLGSGRVDWAAKLNHFDVCPLCMNKRFIVCSECGGHYHRPMFSHRRRQAGGAFEPMGNEQQQQPEQGGYAGPIVLTLAGAGAGGSSQILSSMND